MLSVKQILRAGLQSGTIMSLADVLTQTVVEGNRFDGGLQDPTYDITRTMRWGLCGLVLHGPYFFAGFSAIDKRFGPATSWKVVAQKIVTAQFMLFPPYLCLLFAFMGKLENHPNIYAKIQRQVPETFLSGCVYWPVVNGVNFALVSPTLRVPYLAVSAGIWNSYLSWENQRSNNALARKADDGGAGNV